MNQPDEHQVSNLLQSIIQPETFSDIPIQLSQGHQSENNLLQLLPHQFLINRNPFSRILCNQISPRHPLNIEQLEFNRSVHLEKCLLRSSNECTSERSVPDIS